MMRNHLRALVRSLRRGCLAEVIRAGSTSCCAWAGMARIEYELIASKTASFLSDFVNSLSPLMRKAKISGKFAR